MSAPRCTIVIPVHDRAGLTRRCLDAIPADPPATPFEIVVVDDASTDETPALLAERSGAVRTLRREQNGGFATACNDGAAAAQGELLVFLNNDTEPHPGWLDALVAHADAHPEAAAVGAKLLFPDGSVQHAGVVVCQDGRPRHLYAGFPADHPAVHKPRAFQAVTAACMLVRRAAFERAGGFDPAFRNSLEDVDLCLRLRESGVRGPLLPRQRRHASRIRLPRPRLAGRAAQLRPLPIPLGEQGQPRRHLLLYRGRAAAPALPRPLPARNRDRAGARDSKTGWGGGGADRRAATTHRRPAERGGEAHGIWRN